MSTVNVGVLCKECDSKKVHREGLCARCHKRKIAISHQWVATLVQCSNAFGK